MRPKRTIALLLDTIGTDYQDGLRLAAVRAASELEVSVLTVVGRRLHDPEPRFRVHNRVYDCVTSSRVDGVVVVSSCLGNYLGSARLAEFCKRFAPLQVVSLGGALPGIPSVVVDNRSGFRQVTEHLLSVHGCRRIALVQGPPDSDEARERLSGYLDAHRAFGIEPDRRWLLPGNFEPIAGRRAVQQVLGRGESPDAILAVNDLMALGVLDALRERGVSVPTDLLVAGFDDFPTARVAFPSLTTVRQSTDELLRASLSLVLRGLDGEDLPAVTRVGVEIVCRQSCGCGYVGNRLSRSLDLTSERRSTPPLAPAEDRVAWLQQRLHQSRLPADELSLWCERLTTALEEAIAARSGQRFLLELELVLDDAHTKQAPLDEFVPLIDLFRQAYSEHPQGRSLENWWLAAIALIGVAMAREQGRARLELEFAIEELSRRLESVSTALDHEALKDALLRVLPNVGVNAAAIALFSADGALTPYFRLDSSDEGPFSARDPLHQRPWDEGSESRVDLLMPLSMGERTLGLVRFADGASPHTYLFLRDQISAAVTSATLHAAVVKETALRERAEREQFERELRIATNIQNGMQPSKLAISGFELAAHQIPAIEIGGDYFDVVPASDGGWIGIGDVSGHGLLAGILMTMLHSSLAASLRAASTDSPAQMLTFANSVLHENMRQRLKRDDLASACLLRVRASGAVEVAGEHEELIIYRARTRTCEALRPRGLWLGVVPDLSPHVSDQAFDLEPGDAIVLYTDGLPEAREARGEKLGMERVIQVVQAHGDGSAAALCAGLIEAVTTWSPSLRDDVTVIVARYVGHP
jgi:DNA-binding LacI/PurR family transcriptional regulator/serine phosphatase RsbU (regulator of sigma subunit)